MRLKNPDMKNSLEHKNFHLINGEIYCVFESAMFFFRKLPERFIQFAALPLLVRVGHYFNLRRACLCKRK